MTVSLCMIVKNEEEVLGRCLSSASNLMDEVIIVDTGSSDGTVKVAESFGAKVYSFEWIDDFASARNYAFSLGSSDYLLWLDADDFITPENAERFIRLKADLESEKPDIVMSPYEIIADGKPVLRFMRERIVKRSAGFQWQGRVHECIAPHGKVLSSDFCVQHLGSGKPRGSRNLDIYRKWKRQEPLDGRNLFYYGRELYYNEYFSEAENTLESMLDGDGWYINKIEACLVLADTRRARNNCEGALFALYQSFCYGEPRAKVCVKIAELLHETNRLSEAEYWYKAALLCRDHSAEGDFEDDLARSLTPLLGLCRLSYERGDLKKSYEYHKQAEALFPDHPSVEYNRNYFLSHPIE
ncbi:MAG: glycosyltransferase family 2 protein [Clostridia bacterium]|nr:glycosyltransferase family 2 protein [Clostridia bacterium]